MRKLWMTDTNKDKQKIKFQPNPHTEPQTKDNPKHKTLIISYLTYNKLIRQTYPKTQTMLLKHKWVLKTKKNHKLSKNSKTMKYSLWCCKGQLWNKMIPPNVVVQIVLWSEKIPASFVTHCLSLTGLCVAERGGSLVQDRSRNQKWLQNKSHLIKPNLPNRRHGSSAVILESCFFYPPVAFPSY